MKIYLIMIFLWMIIYLYMEKLSKKIKANWKLIYTTITGFILLLVMGLRSPSVGNDTFQYLYRYNFLTKGLTLDLFQEKEFGYELLNTSLKLFDVNNQLYLFIISFIIIISFWSFYYRYSKNIFISIFLHVTIGLFTMSMTGIRQTISVSIVLWAFHYALKDNFIKFLFFIILAYSFHNSAIIFLPVYFMRNIYINKVNGIVLILIVSSLFFFRRLLVPIISMLTPEKYIGNYLLITSENPVNPLIILVSIAIPIVALIVWNKEDVIETREKKLYSMLFLMAILNIVPNIMSLNSNIIGRLGFYFMPFAAVLIPNTIATIRNKEIQILGIYFSIVLPLIQFLLTTPGGTLGIDNYDFFWR